MASKTKRSTSLTWLLLLFISLLFSFSANKAIAARNLAANYAGKSTTSLIDLPSNYNYNQSYIDRYIDIYDVCNFVGSDDERGVSRRGLGSSPCKRGRETSEVAEGVRTQGFEKPYDNPRCHNYL